MRALIFIAPIVHALVPAAASAAPKVTPGQWQSTTIIDNVTMPGLPPEALAMMKGRPTTVTYCLTPEEAEADPKKMLAADKSCKVDRFDITDSTIDAAFTCKTDQGPATMTMTGTHNGTSYAMKNTMQSGPMTMASHATGKYLGPCK